MKKLIILCGFLSGIFTLNAQTAGSHIFNNKILHEIRIAFSTDNFWDSLNNYYDAGSRDFDGNRSQPIQYLKANIDIDGKIVEQVGVRIKGFSSTFLQGEDQRKQPLKLDFNEFVKGQKYDGLRKFNLNNGVLDPTFLRDVLAYHLMRAMGIRVPRTAYAKVYMNDTYWGVYLIVEQIDRTFVKNSFDKGSGDLYKNQGGHFLVWEDNSVESYRPELELKTNEESSDERDLIGFLDTLNNISDTAYEEAISKVFNMPYYLRTLAVDVLLNNWDSYLDHGRNYYFYHEPSSDLFHWIPWDYNLSFGGRFTLDSAKAVQSFDPPDFRPLIDRTLGIPAYKQQYLDIVDLLRRKHFTKEKLNVIIDANMSLIRNAIEEDNNYFFTMQEFDQDKTILNNYIDQRLEEVRNELNELNFETTGAANSFDVAFQDIVINEFLAANSGDALVDQNGEANDWVELYNTTPKAIRLEGFSLTDIRHQVNKWVFPDTVILPNEHLIVWLDNDTEQDGLHANFRLAADGENLALYSDQYILLDSLTFGQQETNISYARIPNGSGNFQKTAPTFAAANQALTGVPLIPYVLAASNITANTFTANWQAVPNASDYQIDVATDSNFTNLLTNYSERQVNLTRENIVGLQTNTVYYYRVVATNDQGISDYSDTISLTTTNNNTFSFGDITINEFIARGNEEGGIADQDGEYDDWIELYNNTNSAIELKDFYLTDGKNPLKWNFPDTLIAANGYLIVWADEDGEQAGLHANFKLSGSGENIKLSFADAAPVDSVIYPAQDKNISYARVPNGTGSFEKTIITFAAENRSSAPTALADESVASTNQVTVYPIPSTQYLNITVEQAQGEPSGLQITDYTGRIVSEEYTQTAPNRYRIDINHLSPGVYILSIRIKGERYSRRILKY